MEKPSLSEVKEYFKDAAKIKDHAGDIGFLEADKLEFAILGDGIIQNAGRPNWLVLWCSDKGYAKILTYKNTEPKFEIPKEQILEMAEWGTIKDLEKVKKWFPEVFKPVFNNGYYKHKNGAHPKWFSYADFKTKEYYGCGTLGEWFRGKAEYHIKYIIENCEPMTPEEVIEALKKEAVRRGFVDGDFCKWRAGELIKCEFLKLENGKLFCNEDNIIMDMNGQWATVIQTKTIQQAEELLKELGHEIKIVS